ncbi:MAG TPA: hypothetical protein VFY68_05170 [Nitrososphaeraceae archaeon]|nr:hypothetical protein [Nitrososphaeraceae archaeon]
MRNGEKDKKKIEKEREKRERPISPQWHLYSFSSLFPQNLSDFSSAAASYYGISRTT